uniref:Uncharacterized protein n=1 Tax=Oryza brachyantha TaxID=4533 RepID=J3N815_ORYBR
SAIGAGGAYPLGEAVAVGGLAAAGAHVDVVLGRLDGDVLPLAIAGVSGLAGEWFRVLVCRGVSGELAFLGLLLRLRQLRKIDRCRAGWALRFRWRNRARAEEYLCQGRRRRSVLPFALGAGRLPLPAGSVAARPIARR